MISALRFNSVGVVMEAEKRAGNRLCEEATVTEHQSWDNYS
jgi:hypothetical protein